VQAAEGKTLHKGCIIWVVYMQCHKMPYLCGHRPPTGGCRIMRSAKLLPSTGMVAARVGQHL
jgi:hypothetical protein